MPEEGEETSSGIAPLPSGKPSNKIPEERNDSDCQYSENTIDAVDADTGEFVKAKYAERHQGDGKGEREGQPFKVINLASGEKYQCPGKSRDKEYQ